VEDVKAFFVRDVWFGWIISNFWRVFMNF